MDSSRVRRITANTGNRCAARGVIASVQRQRKASRRRTPDGPAGFDAPDGPIDSPGVPRSLRLTAGVLTIAYLAVVAWLTLRPVAVAWVPPTNTRPFATIGAEFTEGPRAALRHIGTGVTLLAPLGVLFPLLGRRLGGSAVISFTRTVFAGAMISLALGMARSVLPSRQADIDALILNTLGVALVHLLCFAPLRRWFPGAREERDPAPGPDAAHRDGPPRGRVVPGPFTDTRFGGIADPDGDPEEGPGMTPISSRPDGDRAGAGRGPGSPGLVRPV
ncbi:hypothetical protein FNQ90_05310 [Streptomyces alkaliphilus]|uniref:VanZ-like domain-containing protein n=1 Tax=Streptomyces alkaliphilus TaxID=1472722 RepID=A0A7W3TBR8_9ACTN|nr:hypothetical protein [Streptomyces alkaliphilus]